MRKYIDRKTERLINEAVEEIFSKLKLDEDSDYTTGRGDMVSAGNREPARLFRNDSNKEYVSDPAAFTKAVNTHIDGAVSGLKDYVYNRLGNNPRAKTIITKCITLLTKIQKIANGQTSEGIFGPSAKQKAHKASLDEIISNLTWVINTKDLMAKLGSKADKCKVFIQKVIDLLGGEISMDVIYTKSEILQKLRGFVNVKDIDGAIDFLKLIRPQFK